MTLTIQKQPTNINVSFKKAKAKPISTVRFNLMFKEQAKNQMLKDSKSVIDQLEKLRVKRIVFSPECKDVKKIMAYAHEKLKLKTTLSVQGERLKQFQETLLFVDEIELTQENLGAVSEIEDKINLIKYLQKHHPYVAVTLKTTVSSNNKDSLAQLIKLLEPLSFYDPKFKWKVYQIRKKDALNQTEIISKEQFKASFSKMYLETLWADYPFLEKYDEDKNDDQTPQLQVFSNGQVFCGEHKIFVGDILHHPRAFFDHLKRIKPSL